MVGFEGVAVGVAEGDGEFVGGVGEVVLDGLGGKIETAGEGEGGLVGGSGGWGRRGGRGDDTGLARGGLRLRYVFWF